VVTGLAAASPAYVPNALNQYGSVGGTAFTYDVRGNLTSDGVWTFGYDTENHLVSAAKTGTTVAYTYDPIGRRHLKTGDDAATPFLFAGQKEIVEYTLRTCLSRRRRKLHR
jgi:YD repeat-containing protein